MGDLIYREKSSFGQDPLHALLLGLLDAAKAQGASSIHFYLNNKSNSCYFQTTGKLQKPPKKLSDKVTLELADYLKKSANLEKSELSIIQTATLDLDKISPLSLSLIQSPEYNSSHLILYLDGSAEPIDFEGLGFWGGSLELLETALDAQKGLIVIDSLDPFSPRAILGACLRYLNQYKILPSITFDSSLAPDLPIANNDRIYTKVSFESLGMVKKVLATNQPIILFMDKLDQPSLQIATDQAELGKLVFIITSEGSASASLHKLLRSSAELIEKISLIVSASPIQTIKSSNGNHQLTSELISQLERYFQIDLPESWRSIYRHAGVKAPQDLLELDFPVASEYGSLTHLIETFSPPDDARRIIGRSPEISTQTLHSIALRSGMRTKKEDGLIKALRREVDLASVIEICN